MAKFKTKNGVKFEANQFLVYSSCEGVTKYCNNYIVKSKVGLQTIKQYDYVIKTPGGGYLAIPRDVFEFFMEPDNG
jgi:hypothetical protein